MLVKILSPEVIVKDGSSQTYPNGLYIVATPIGNLGDITLRALEVLKQADLIACEDTRVTAKLLNHYGIKKPTISYNDHNGGERRPVIMDALRDGKRVALVSDAGTPLISDPGYKLVRDVVVAGFFVTTLPGASSVLSALCLSALPTDKFLFAGFLPPKKEAMLAELSSLARTPATLVFFESARRLIATLSVMQQALGNREAAVVREITKLFEESKRGTLAELIAHYEKNGEPKGEVVICVGAGTQEQTSDEDITSHLKKLLATHSVKEAASILAEQTGRPRKELYALALKALEE
ncbi:MAG: 16S rRNA (cytidine(1402)-2'-O)-methyltransferase [Alphaproteobacteria bacterium]|nr:16S rRNA (cytidine(1402)-2'-O)-methyltransferase [Alphaproteobacteria bacterium]